MIFCFIAMFMAAISWWRGDHAGAQVFWAAAIVIAALAPDGWGKRRVHRDE